MKQATFHDECRSAGGRVRDTLDLLEDLANRGNPGQRDALRAHITSLQEANTDLDDITTAMEFEATKKAKRKGVR